MRAWLLLIALAAPAAEPAADPPWVADLVGRFAGMVRNEGRMECHSTVFSLQDGHLVGHYRIEDTDPFEGDLTDFEPGAEGSGTFIWHDRYGTGKEFVMFAPDRGSFTGLWGDAAIDPRNPVSGTRGGTAGCANAVS